MKRKVFKIFLVFIFGFLFCLGSSNRISADAGFDSDYDSDYDSGYDNDYDSGWGGGSSSSSGSSSNRGDYSYSGEPLTGGELALVLIITGAIIAVPLIIVHAPKMRRRKRRVMSPINTSGLPVDEDLNCEVFDIYMDINIAWMNKDLEPVRDLMTDEMYNMYLMQIDTLIEANQTNIMKDFNLVSGHIASKRKYRGVETIIMIFRVKCKDYIIDENGKVVSGNKRVTWDYTYELKLVRNVKKDSIICPSCGETLKNKDGVVCPNCETIIHEFTPKLRLADKKMLRQVKSGW